MVTCLQKDPYLDEQRGRLDVGEKEKMQEKTRGKQSGRDL